ncbi:MAG TPA: GGDEF domain-containing protein [Devosiaceae bacterium]|nr:GGDEF domain-containing protein [Devosiaceae bacterium]
MKLRELPAAAWTAILQWTLLVTVASVTVSISVTQLILSTMSQGMNAAGLAAAVILPILLGTPLIFYHLVRLQQLKLANEKLQVLASTDWLTTCLNRRAFTHLVTDRLEEAPLGAFLVIDADNFKIINDHFGHDRGDEALQLMAETIMASVRKNDIVGRIGGEEFGVFLVDASYETARQVAERIRRAIAAARFTPEGEPHPLSVSVGAACFEGNIDFSELFRIADQLLYGAKQMGRNRIHVAHAADHPPVRFEPPATLSEAAA